MTHDGSRAAGNAEVHLDEVDLFLFSAALWLPHRIHYDRDFVRTEGHDDLLVHGPLQIALLAELVAEREAARGRAVAHFAFRHRAPALVARTFRLDVGEPTATGDGQAVFDCSAVDVAAGVTCTEGIVTTRQGG